MENNENHYVCYITDNIEDINVVAVLNEKDFIILITHLDKARYDIYEINVVTLPLYKNVNYFITKSPEDFFHG